MTLAMVALLAAGTGAAPKRAPDIVMNDVSCSITGAAIGADDTPKAIDGEASLRVCWRGKSATLNCDQLDAANNVTKVVFSIAKEAAQKMILVGTDTDSMAILDWTVREYVIAGARMEPLEGRITHKLCRGNMATGAELRETK